MCSSIVGRFLVRARPPRSAGAARRPAPRSSSGRGELLDQALHPVEALEDGALVLADRVEAGNLDLDLVEPLGQPGQPVLDVAEAIAGHVARGVHLGLHLAEPLADLRRAPRRRLPRSRLISSISWTMAISSSRTGRSGSRRRSLCSASMRASISANWRCIAAAVSARAAPRRCGPDAPSPLLRPGGAASASASSAWRFASASFRQPGAWPPPPPLPPGASLRPPLPPPRGGALPLRARRPAAAARRSSLRRHRSASAARLGRAPRRGARLPPLLLLPPRAGLASAASAVSAPRATLLPPRAADARPRRPPCVAAPRRPNL